MRAQVLDDAIAEAERFLKAAKRAKRMAGSRKVESLGNEVYYDGGQWCAAAKRASMDLTRALVAVRRGH